MKRAVFNGDDVTTLLDAVESVKPMGADQWNEVRDIYNTAVQAVNPSKCKTMDQLREKFKALKNTSKPTGQGKCPEHIARAILLQKGIEEVHLAIHSSHSLSTFYRHAV